MKEIPPDALLAVQLHHAHAHGACPTGLRLHAHLARLARSQHDVSEELCAVQPTHVHIEVRK